MGIRRTEGSEIFCKVVGAGFFFFFKMIFEQGLRKTVGADHVDNWENNSTNCMLVITEAGAAAAEGGRCEANRHLQGNEHQVTEDLKLWKGELLREI